MKEITVEEIAGTVKYLETLHSECQKDRINLSKLAKECGASGLFPTYLKAAGFLVKKPYKLSYTPMYNPEYAQDEQWVEDLILESRFHQHRANNKSKGKVPKSIKADPKTIPVRFYPKGVIPEFDIEQPKPSKAPVKPADYKLFELEEEENNTVGKELVLKNDVATEERVLRPIYEVIDLDGAAIRCRFERKSRSEGELIDLVRKAVLTMFGAQDALLLDYHAKYKDTEKHLFTLKCTYPDGGEDTRDVEAFPNPSLWIS